MTYGLRDMNGARVELCDECGFDGRETRDLPAALAEAFLSLEQHARHADADRRPQEETWSGTEYAEHCLDVTAAIVAMSHRAAGRPEPEAPASLPAAAAAAAQLVRDLSDAQWQAPTDGWPFELSVRGAMTHLLHDLEHHVWDIRRGYARLALADGLEVITSRPGR